MSPRPPHSGCRRWSRSPLATPSNCRETSAPRTATSRPTRHRSGATRSADVRKEHPHDFDLEENVVRGRFIHLCICGRGLAKTVANDLSVNFAFLVHRIVLYKVLQCLLEVSGRCLHPLTLRTKACEFINGDAPRGAEIRPIRESPNDRCQLIASLGSFRGQLRVEVPQPFGHVRNLLSSPV